MYESDEERIRRREIMIKAINGKYRLRRIENGKNNQTEEESMRNW